MARFSVVAMMRESSDIVRRFVDYYQALGASEIFIYFNGPPDEIPLIPGAIRTNCDADLWARHSDLPLETLEDRMRICYRDCHPRCTTGWLLVCDADEFVFSDRSLGALLDTVPDEVDSVGFPTAEAVWGPGDDLDEPFGSTYFRVPWPRDMQWRLLRRPIYGSVSALMRSGLLGHTAGKHMIRTDRSYTLVGGHRTMRGDEVVTKPASGLSKLWAGTYVGHFDAIGLARWERKWTFRLQKEVVASGMGRLRREQMEMVGEALARGEARALFRSFYELSSVQYHALSLLGHAFRRENFFERASAVAPEVRWTEPRLQTTPTPS